MGQFLENHKLLKLTQDEIISIVLQLLKNELIIEKLSKKKYPSLEGFNGDFHQTFKKLALILYTLS